MDSSQIEEILSSNISEEEKEVSFESPGSVAENLDAIKKFIEQQEKEILENISNISENTTKTNENEEAKAKVAPDEQCKVAPSFMDMILSEPVAKISNHQVKDTHKEHFTPVSKSNHSILSPKDNGKGSMSLSIGSKVEVKDFEDDWYSAEIVEVDYEDMEVLIHYKAEWKKHDEWINVSSPRLRPFTGKTLKPLPEVKVEAKEVTTEEPIALSKVEVKEESLKVEDKTKVIFEVGERCLAKWRDNRRFVATIQKDLGEGKFEVMFDDGVHWTCTLSRLSKMKGEKGDYLSIDTSFQSASVGSPSPLDVPGPSSAPISPSIPPVFHTHLFDPTRDYLGSKSERREKKRKLNIKEIFNIDQRKYKMPKTEKPKTKTEKKTEKNVAKKEMGLRVAKIELAKVTKNDVMKQQTKAQVPVAVNKQKEVSPGQEKCDTAQDLNDELDKCAAELGKLDDDMDYDDRINDIEPIGGIVDPNAETLDDEDAEELKSEGDPVLEEEVTLENFEIQDVQKHEDVIYKIKEAIIKLEHGLNENVVSPEVKREVISPKLEIKTEELISENDQEMTNLKDLELSSDIVDVGLTNIKMDEKESNIQDAHIKHNISKENTEKSKKDLARIKKNRKLRILKRKQANTDMERVKRELARMKRKYEEMKKEMYEKSQGSEYESQGVAPLPESCLPPQQWCCRWVNGQPVGRVSEVEGAPPARPDARPALPRRSVEVHDRRLPPGWIKHMVRRSAGNSAGKWHVVLVSPEECGSKKFHTKADMRNFLEHNTDPALIPYQHALMDFGVHLKVSRRMGWIVNTPDGIAEGPDTILPAGSSCSHSPQLSRKKIGLKKRGLIMKDKQRGLLKRDKKRRPIKLKLQKGLHTYNSQIVGGEFSGHVQTDSDNFEQSLMPLEDGYVYVGSLKVQILENLLRCPAEGCFKNFRTKTLLQMHIKHYHRQLIAKMGATPKVLDLAYARTMPNDEDIIPTVKKIIKVKIQKPPKREELKIYTPDIQETSLDSGLLAPIREEIVIPKIPRSQDSPKLRHALANKPVKRPRVLLPVRKPEPEQNPSDSTEDLEPMEPVTDIPMLGQALDFEAAISTHTVTKPLEKKKKGEKKKSFASFSKNISEDEEMFAIESDDFDTRSSFPRSGTPDSKIMDNKMAEMSSESNEDQKDNMYTYTETGERIKIEHMKREEIINCHCGLREEDGLMVQCELCLCWQHALCHNIQRPSEVPEKYTCSICLNPRRGRRSRRFVHDQDRLYEGALTGAKAKESLRRSHELAGNLLRIQDALHAVKVKTYVATKKDHPKLYLWAKDWEQTEMFTADRLNSEYSDMQVMINGIGKENLPVRDECGISSPLSEDNDNERVSRDQLGSQSLLSGLLSSPGGASLELALNSSEFDRIANSVQEVVEWHRAPAPQPEAAIENGACRARLLRHIQRCQLLIDTRLHSIEAQVAELESQEPSFGEHYETAESYPRTKQTIQMLLRDLDTMEELGVIT